MSIHMNAMSLTPHLDSTRTSVTVVVKTVYIEVLALPWRVPYSAPVLSKRMLISVDVLVELCGNS
jgi:hypothetical protein